MGSFLIADMSRAITNNLKYKEKGKLRYIVFCIIEIIIFSIGTHALSTYIVWCLHNG